MEQPAEGRKKSSLRSLHSRSPGFVSRARDIRTSFFPRIFFASFAPAERKSSRRRAVERGELTHRVESATYSLSLFFLSLSCAQQHENNRVTGRFFRFGRRTTYVPTYARVANALYAGDLFCRSSLAPGLQQHLTPPCLRLLLAVSYRFYVFRFVFETASNQQ